MTDNQGYSRYNEAILQRNANDKDSEERKVGQTSPPLRVNDDREVKRGTELVHC